MHSKYGWSIAAQLKWKEKAMIAEEYLVYFGRKDEEEIVVHL